MDFGFVIFSSNWSIYIIGFKGHSVLKSVYIRNDNADYIIDIVPKLITHTIPGVKGPYFSRYFVGQI